MMFHKRLNYYIKTIKVQLISAVLFSVLSAVFIVFQAKYLSGIINDIFLEHKSFAVILPAIYILIIISLFRFFSDWFTDSISNRFARKIKLKLKNDVISHLSKLSPVQIQSEKRGELIITLNEGIQKLDAYFSEYIPQVIISVAIPICYLFFVFPADILTGIVLLVTAPLIPIFMVLIGSTAQEKTRKQWQSLSRLGAYFLDTIQGLMTLKIFERTRDRKKVMNSLSGEFSSKTMDILKIAFLSALVFEMVATIATAVVAVEVGIRLLYGKIVFEQALFVLIIAPEFYMPLRMLGSRFHSGTEGIAAAERIFKILDIPIQENSKPQKNINETIQSITFDSVKFAYDSRKNRLFEKVSFKIDKGKITAITGETGSGKSSLAYLLVNFIRPQSGYICVNDTQLSNIDSKWWRNQISYVHQMPYMFDTSIRENLLFARKDASDDIMHSVLKQVYLYDFVQSLPNKLETSVGENGFHLSGGQIQRIAIARGLLNQTPIIIFDEITSNVDLESERLFLKTLDTIKKDKLILLIAHRLKIINSADIVYHLEKGQLHKITKDTYFESLQNGDNS